MWQKKVKISASDQTLSSNVCFLPFLLFYCMSMGCYKPFPELLKFFRNKLPIYVFQSTDWMSVYVSMGCYKTFPELLKLFRNKFLIYAEIFSPGNIYFLAEAGFACMTLCRMYTYIFLVKQYFKRSHGLAGFYIEQ